jgi:hypothetical protein
MKDRDSGVHFDATKTFTAETQRGAEENDEGGTMNDE